jgi:PAS domain-containing protein
MFAAITEQWTTSDLIAITGAVAVNVLILFAAWIKFKTTLAENTRDLKCHTDVSVQKLNGMLTYVIHSFDRPAWIKVAREENGKVQFRMLELNELYAEKFGISRNDYIGKTDLEAGWDLATAKKFEDHDLLTWASGEPQTFVEKVDGQPMRFRKIRITTKDGKSKGVMGYAIDCADPEHCPVYKKDHPLYQVDCHAL